MRLSEEGAARLRGRTALVLGAARSGLAAAELLLAAGARVILSDRKTLAELGGLPETLTHPDLQVRLGESPETLFAACDFVVISPGIPLASPVLDAARTLGIPIVGELALAASCARQDIAAVSGTNGKTTTVSLLGEMFRASGRDAYVAGNIGYPLSRAVLDAKSDADALVAEVSSFQLETVGDFHPHAAALLNITPDHLDRHGTMEAYAAHKERLFVNMGPQDSAVLNLDDPLVAGMAPGIRAQVSWFSLEADVPRGAALRDGHLVLLDGGRMEPLCAAEELRIPGRHNIQNALAASAMAAVMGVPPPDIARTLREFRGVEHRIEFVEEIGGVAFLNDSKGTNPDSTIKAVESLRAPAVLIAGGYDKQVPFDEMARVILRSGLVRHVVTLGQTAAQIREALEKAGYTAVLRAETLGEAVRTAYELAREGEAVLFSPACASFDMFRDYEERGRVFKQLVRELKEEQP
ncbi:MAG TPA: UDP-N-acetylmuramoyl-L-alanine--D-glutamate ligase [Candidatus Limnocylindria bacterium]|nr:UDP-N-acetylmuramoyl-L-alanine--D-glutamate ligase [Candidatus Limnocylindria bacterium]